MGGIRNHLTDTHQGKHTCFPLAWEPFCLHPRGGEKVSTSLVNRPDPPAAQKRDSGGPRFLGEMIFTISAHVGGVDFFLLVGKMHFGAG
jgi:hypothetical protein